MANGISTIKNSTLRFMISRWHQFDKEKQQLFLKAKDRDKGFFFFIEFTISLTKPKPTSTLIAMDKKCTAI